MDQLFNKITLMSRVFTSTQNIIVLNYMNYMAIYKEFLLLNEL